MEVGAYSWIIVEEYLEVPIILEEYACTEPNTGITLID